MLDSCNRTLLAGFRPWRSSSQAGKRTLSFGSRLWTRPSGSSEHCRQTDKKGPL